MITLLDIDKEIESYLNEDRVRIHRIDPVTLKIRKDFEYDVELPNKTVYMFELQRIAEGYALKNSHQHAFVIQTPRNGLAIFIPSNDEMSNPTLGGIIRKVIYRNGICGPVTTSRDITYKTYREHNGERFNTGTKRLGRVYRIER